MRSRVGGGQKTVIRSSRSHGTRSGPSRTTSSSITTRVAPQAKASQISSTEES